MAQDLAGKKILITGGSRGIGLAIAKRAAADGAMVAIAAKTTDPHPTLPGTIYTAADEIRDAGGVALPIQCDLRDEKQIESAVAQTVAEFGGLDILINNASAINLTPTLATPAKRFDMMFSVNVRATFLTSQAAIPHLKESAAAGRNPHILTMSPPLSMSAKWFKPHLAYTMAKYGMSMCVLGLAEEFKRDQATRKENRKYEDFTEPQMIKEINKLDKAMQKAAKNLEFELAANIRDQIKYLKARVYGASIEDRI